MPKINQSIAKKDLDALVQIIAKGFAATASRQDLKQFTTKQDLERFATKEDLKQFATKQDFSQMQLRLESKMEKLDTNVEHLQASVHRVQQDIGEIKTHVYDYGTNRAAGTGCFWQNRPGPIIFKPDYDF